MEDVQSDSNNIVNWSSNRLQTIYEQLITTVHILHSEAYFCFIDLMQIAFYPSGNRITSNRLGPWFPPIKRSVISELGQSECHSLTGLSQSQLLVLYRHLRIPDTWSYEDRHSFTGEESVLRFMVSVQISERKLRMSTNYFGGDPRRFTYSIRLVTNHL